MSKHLVLTHLHAFFVYKERETIYVDYEISAVLSNNKFLSRKSCPAHLPIGSHISKHYVIPHQNAFFVYKATDL